jgi:tetratricopeptide (TPR) repeat protein
MDSLNGLVQVSYAEFLYSVDSLALAKEFFKKAFRSKDLLYSEKVNIAIGLLNHEEFTTFNQHLGEVLEVLKKKHPQYRTFAISADYNIKMEKYENAVIDLDSCLNHDKSNVIIWEQQLFLLNYLERYDEMHKTSLEGLKHHPNSPGLYLFKAYAEFYSKNYNESKNTLQTGEKYIEDNEVLIQYYNVYADNYRELEVYDSSDYYYEKILEIEPENLMIRNNYSYYLSLRGEKLDLAEKLSRYTIKQYPENPTYLDTYGWILYKMGKVKQAKEYVEKAIRLGAGNNEEVLDHMAEILYEIGNCEEAIEYWKKSYAADSLNRDIRDKLQEKEDECL